MKPPIYLDILTILREVDDDYEKYGDAAIHHGATDALRLLACFRAGITDTRGQASVDLWDRYRNPKDETAAL